MKTFFLSDIHGNLPALELCLKNYDENDNFIILGDTVNYGPWNNECIELIETLPNKTCIRGNHEDYFIAGNYENGGIVSEFLNVCLSDFKYIDILKRYKDICKFKNFICSHTIDNRYIFKDTVIKVEYNYLIGHSHQQFLNKLNNKLIINPGSVGQNRSNLNLISYSYYDHNLDKFEFLNIEYDSNIIINKMKDKKFPYSCIEYYESKK